jgi:hypothetical protein
MQTFKKKSCKFFGKILQIFLRVGMVSVRLLFVGGKIRE